MATAALTQSTRGQAAARATSEPPLVELALTTIAVGFLLLFLVVPLVAVFVQSFEKGWPAYAAALREPMALSVRRGRPAGVASRPTAR